MGFKAEQFVKGVDENLFCSICHEVFEDPVSCKDGHTFCKDCIHEWLKTNRKCPLDNGFLKKNHLVCLLTVKAIIDNLEVHCQPPTQDKKSQVKVELRCDWVGKLQNLTQHKTTCLFQEVKCPHAACSLTMKRRELENHEKICDFRKVNCEKCGTVLLQYENEKHIKDDCLQAMIFCPNQCKDSPSMLFFKLVKRIDMADHLSNVCPKAIVDCPYREQGCEVKVERQDVEKHVQENMAAHMMLLAKECSSLRKQNTSLTDKCSALVRKNKEVQDELKRIKEEFRNQLLSTCTYTWVIHEYPNLSEKCFNGYRIYSPPFWLCGYQWRIVLYPNGNNQDATGFLSLFLQKIENDLQASSDIMPNISSNHTTILYREVEVSCSNRLTVISLKPGTGDVSREGKSVFTKEKHSYGFLRFMKASDALSPSYCRKGKLTIQCTIQLDKPQ